MANFGTQKSLGDKKQELKAIQKRIDASAKTEAEYKKKLKAMGSAKIDLDVISKEEESVKKNIAKLNKEGLASAVSLKAMVNEKNLELEELQRAEKKLVGEVGNMAKNLADERDILENIKKESGALKAHKEEELANIDNVIKAKEKLLPALNKELSTVVDDVTTLEKKRNASQEILDDFEKNLSSFEETLSVASQAVAKLKEEEEGLIRKNERITDELKEGFEFLDIEKQKFATEVAQKESELVGREGDVSRKIIWVETSRKELKNIKKELEDFYKKTINITI